MKKKVLLIVPLIAVGVVALSVHNATAPSKASVSTPTGVPVAISKTDAQCHVTQMVLPDPNCTPGAVNPAVTQANIHQTICVSGYTKTIRPKSSYTTKLKKQQIIQYGYSDTKLQDYEEDHLISLELGGAPSDPKNLWPEFGNSPNHKDAIEGALHKAVCNGTMPLAEAQQRVASNWTTALSGVSK